MSALNLILLGPPGAGKGTQAARLREDFGLPYIATGDLLREHRDNDTELGREAKTYMERGELVPDDLVVAMILAKIEADGEDGFLLDGFPRNLAQAEALSDALEEGDRRLNAVLLIDVPDELLMERITGRRLCPDGHVYHIKYDPPKHDNVCDQDGKPLVQRDDDKPETVKKRLDVYHSETAPLVEYYDERGLLRRFDGAREMSEVHDHIRATLATLRLEEQL
jgi:adenylate kinase